MENLVQFFLHTNLLISINILISNCVKLLLVHMTPRPKFTIGGSYERYIYSKEWDDKGTNVSSSFN